MILQEEPRDRWNPCTKADDYLRVLGWQWVPRSARASGQGAGADARVPVFYSI